MTKLFTVTTPSQILYSIVFTTLAFYLVTDPAGSIPDAKGWFKTALVALLAVLVIISSQPSLQAEQHVLRKAVGFIAIVASGLFLLGVAYNLFLLVSGRA